MSGALMLDATGDLALEDGRFAVLESTAAIQQAALVELRLHFGQWLLDTSRGVRWRQVVLRKAPDLVEIEGELRLALGRVVGVTAIASYSQSYDRATRHLTVQIQLQTTQDDTPTPLTLQIVPQDPSDGEWILMLL